MFIVNSPVVETKQGIGIGTDATYRNADNVVFLDCGTLIRIQDFCDRIGLGKIGEVRHLFIVKA